MSKQYVVQAWRVHLKDNADALLSKRAFDEVQQWLTQWSCRVNFKATFAPSQHEGIEKVQAFLAAKLVPSFPLASGVKPEHFEFTVSMTEVEDGWFWPDPCAEYMTWHPVVGQIKWGK